MKKILVIFTMFLFAVPTFGKYTELGKWQSWYRLMNIEIANNTEKTIEIVIVPGLMFVPTSSDEDQKVVGRLTGNTPAKKGTLNYYKGVTIALHPKEMVWLTGHARGYAPRRNYS